MDERDKLINDLRRENAELKELIAKDNEGWRDDDPEDEDAYLVLWEAYRMNGDRKVWRGPFYAFIGWYEGAGWDYSQTMLNYEERDYKVQVIAWLDLIAPDKMADIIAGDF